MTPTHSGKATLRRVATSRCADRTTTVARAVAFWVGSSAIAAPVFAQECQLPLIVTTGPCAVPDGTTVTVTPARAVGVIASSPTGQLSADSITVNLAAANTVGALAEGGASITFDGATIARTGAGANGQAQSGIRVTGAGSTFTLSNSTISLGSTSGTLSLLLGARADNGGVLTINNSTVNTTANTNAAIGNNHGLVSSGADSRINFTGGAINVLGSRGSFGVFAENQGTIVLSGGTTINTTGNRIVGPPPVSNHGIYAINADSLITGTDITITSAASGANGARAAVGGTVRLTDSTINISAGSVANELSGGIKALDAGTVEFTGGSITTTGAAVPAVLSEGVDSTVIVDGATLSASGTNSGTVLVRTGGAATLRNSTVTNSSGSNQTHSIQVTGSGSDAEVTDTPVSMGNFRGRGIAAQAQGNITITRGSVTVAGDEANGLRADTAGTLTANGTTVVTQGADAYGLVTHGTGSAVTAQTMTITTDGEGAHAAVVSAGANLITEAGTSLTVSGDSALALLTIGDVGQGTSATLRDSTLTNSIGPTIGVAGEATIALVGATVSGSGNWLHTGDVGDFRRLVDLIDVPAPPPADEPEPPIVPKPVPLQQAAESGAAIVSADGSMLSGSVTLSAGSTLALTLNNGTVWNISGDSATTSLALDRATLNYDGAFALSGAMSLGASGATLNTNAFDVTLEQAISGSGGLLKEGSGVLLLTGDNTYTGGTTINAGVVQVGNGAATGSLTGNVTNNGALVFNRSDDVTYQNVMSGSGMLTQQGPGVLTFTADQLYTGQTTIAAGTLQLGDGATAGSVAGPIANDGTLIFNRTSAVTQQSEISGSGAVIKNADSSLTLAGSHSYTGPTTVNSGTLIANGVLASTVAVQPGAVLMGIGTVGGISNSGRVVPGQSVGTLTVTGDFVQNSTGELEIELTDRNEFDVVSVGGSAALAGRVVYAPDTTSTFADELLYTYLPVAGGVTGSFTNPVQEYAGVVFETVYNPDSVQVHVVPVPIPDEIVDPGGEDLVACVQSLDARRGLVAGTSAAPVLNALVTTPVSELGDVVHGLCPRDPSALPTAINAQIGSRFGLLTNRIAQVHGGEAADNALFDDYRLREGVGFWFRGTYLDGKQERRDILRTGYDSSNRGFSMGLDVALGAATVVGAYLASDDLDLNYRAPVYSEGQSGQVEDRAWTLGLYGSYWSDARWFIQGTLEYGWHDLESTRYGELGLISFTAEGDRDAQAFATMVGAGFNFAPAASWLIQPQITVSYTRFADDGYTETGADSINLTYSEMNADTLRTEAGFTVRKALINTEGTGEVTVFYLYANYVYEDALDDRNLTAQFAIAEPFPMIGDEDARDGIRYGLGFENTWRHNTSIQIVLDAQDYGELETLAASLQLRKQF